MPALEHARYGDDGGPNTRVAFDRGVAKRERQDRLGSVVLKNVFQVRGPVEWPPCGFWPRLRTSRQAVVSAAPNEVDAQQIHDDVDVDRVGPVLLLAEV